MPFLQYHEVCIHYRQSQSKSNSRVAHIAKEREVAKHYDSMLVTRS